jgi:hypothetical protein
MPNVSHDVLHPAVSHSVALARQEMGFHHV